MDCSPSLRQVWIAASPRACQPSPSLWRYRPVLPVLDDANIVTLGEGWTPLIHAGNALFTFLGFIGMYVLLGFLAILFLPMIVLPWLGGA